MGKFWLQVKEEYISENFTELVNYLKSYTSKSDGGKDSDFEDTYNCLYEVANKRCEELQCNTNLFRKKISDSEFKGYVNIILAAIITSYRIKQKTEYILILKLLNILLLYNKGSETGLYLNMLDFAKNCITQCEMANLGVTWDSIDKHQDLILLHLINNTKWSESDKETTKIPSYFFEKKGLTIIDNNGLTISTQNIGNFKNSKIIFDIPDTITIKASRIIDELKGKASPLDVISRCKDLLTEQYQFKPTKTNKKECESGESYVVQIVDKRYKNIKARTVDSSLNEIEGRVYIKPYTLLSKTLISLETLCNNLELDDYLYAKYIHNPKKGEFEIDYDIYNEFYDEEAELIRSTQSEFKAKYIKDYAGGTTWLSEDGLFINVRDLDREDEKYEDLNTAINKKQIVNLRIRDIAKDKSGHNIINGEFCSMADDSDGIDIEVQAQNNLTQRFIEFCREKYDYTETPTRINDIIGPIVLSRILYKLSIIQGTTTNRLKYLTAALLLANCCDDELSEDKAFMQHEMNFLKCCIEFVSGEKNSKELSSISHDESLKDIEEIKNREQVISYLRNYIEYDDQSCIHEYGTNMDEVRGITDQTVESIKKLVDASNSILETIQPQSLARIKAEIATRLDLADVYKPKTTESDQQYFGVESKTVEFKSSIVFPPCNRRKLNLTAEPDTQKWEIVKTICGFLNSDGGTLYLGVRDNGYPCENGIKEDLEELFNLGKISYKDFDPYRIYIKEIVDSYLESYSKKGKVTDLIDYIPTNCDKDNANNNNNDKHTIVVRIQVKPFKDDAVIICSTRPEWIEKAYLRTSGATRSMNDNEIKELSDKRNHKKNV
jgi:hypothetical protein